MDVTWELSTALCVKIARKFHESMPAAQTIFVKLVLSLQAMSADAVSGAQTDAFMELSTDVPAQSGYRC